MALFLLIRHGDIDLLGKRLAGRLPGIFLNDEGEKQAAKLAARLSRLPLEAICSSPLERARQTAAPLSEALALEVRICHGLTEIDYGQWTGRAIDELDQWPEWRLFNSYRSCTRIPGGELMMEVQTRMVGELERLRQEIPHGTIAVVSHGDPIRAAVAYYAGIGLDGLQRLTIDPASLSMISVNDWGPQIHCLNQTGEGIY